MRFRNIKTNTPKTWHIIKHWYDTKPNCFQYFSIFASYIDENEPLWLFDNEVDEDGTVLYDGDFEVIANGFDEITALNYISTDIPAEIGLYYSYPALD